MSAVLTTKSLWRIVKRMRMALRGFACIATTALILAACAQEGGGVGPSATTPASSPPTEASALDKEAAADLAQWAAAVKAAGGPNTFQPTGELVGQIGDWELAVGDNNKSALYAGLVVADRALSTTTLPNGQITWADGSSTSAPLLSATAALEAIKATADNSCATCTPLRVVGARLTSGPLATSRGRATVPIWAFTLQGTAVEITRVAIAHQITVVPPPWDPYNAPVGISIESAVASPDGRTLTVGFVGAPDPASKPCGEDYTAEARESDLAVVVIVDVHPYAGAVASGGRFCPSVGFARSATVSLAAPLGNRAVLEVKEGLPVSVIRP